MAPTESVREQEVSEDVEQAVEKMMSVNVVARRQRVTGRVLLLISAYHDE